jgi:holo-[acyl-carrier protein] synthase
MLTTRLSTGIDIVFNADVRELLVLEAIDVVFTEEEWQDIHRDSHCLTHLAGKFACKEAVLKALSCGLGDLDLVDIEICKDQKGCPQVRLHGQALEQWRQTGCKELAVSISHHRDYSVAIAIAA